MALIESHLGVRELLSYPEGPSVLILDPQGNDRLIPLREFDATAAAICVQRKNHQGEMEYLLIQRDKEPGKGLWSLPGGRREIEDIDILVLPYSDPNESTFAQVARREIKEETGLRLPRLPTGLMLGFCYPETGHRVVVFNEFLFPNDKAWSTDPSPGEGISTVLWVTGDEISNFNLTAMAEQVLLHFFVEYPYSR